MRFSSAQLYVGVMVAAATAALAAPARLTRRVNCTPTDDDGSALTGSSVDADDSFATCSYKDAGECTYFFADGSFSSGSSTCPKGLPQDAASSSSSNTGGSTSGSGSSSSSSSSGSISPNINCAAVDDDGSPLTASSADAAHDFATCEYQKAGECTYFFADGSFSSGGSTCPPGEPQTGGAATTTSTTAAAKTTTTAAPPPPPTTTSTTSTPPPAPPTTTSSTETSTSTSSTQEQITSTSTFFSTIQPSSTSTSAPPETTTTSAPVAAPTTSTDDSDDFTTVFVPPSATPSATDGVANSGSNTNAAGRARTFTAGAAVPLAFVVWALL
ncbi:hypothetical protein FB451DRAFT_1401525 [Mycena latifolia]|nr:hypothetical protein FB451DRAFT_1401525 [Mycena latifolia]